MNPESYVKNPSLIHRVVSGEVSPKNLVDLSYEELWPEKYSGVEKMANMGTFIKLEDRADGAFKCGKCKSWKTDYIEVQTRSADEPTTKKVVCHQCGHRWKFC